MALRYPRRRWRTGPWTLMGASSGNIEVPDEPIVPYSGPGGLGPGMMGKGAMGDLENLKKYPDNELWKYGKIPDSATMMPKSSTYGVSGASAGSATKKKGLSMSNMIKALSEMKKPPDMRPAPAGAYGERRPQLPAPPQFAALGGVNPSIMNTGGLPGARNKKWWEIMGYS